MAVWHPSDTDMQTARGVAGGLRLEGERIRPTNLILCGAARQLNINK